MPVFSEVPLSLERIPLADQRRCVVPGFGIDVASQRADALDEKALAFLASLREKSDAASALDLACGLGGQARRMAALGVSVAAVDQQDQPTLSPDALTHRGAPTTLWFVQADMRHLPLDLPFAPYDAICCQRALHYLPYAEAHAVLLSLKALMKKRARLFVSVSGLPSELRHGYVHAALPVTERFAPLGAEMALRHGIESPVCLYEAQDLVDLLHEAGYGVQDIGVSPFGNIKAVAFV